MDRRAFIGSLALGTLTVPRAVSAQPARKVARIGILTSTSMTSDMIGPQPRDPAVNALLRGLRELGYVYGENFVTESRGCEGRPERLSSLAAELVRLQVDVIVAGGPTLAALKEATSTIPVVMGGSDDPVGRGFVRSLGHPGANFTGLSRQGVETTGTDWTVEWYRTTRGEAPAQTFLASLEGPLADEATALLLLAEARGNALREPHSKGLGDGLFELRGRRGVRLFYTFRSGRRLIVLDGIVKKRQDIPVEVLARVRGYQRAV